MSTTSGTSSTERIEFDDLTKSRRRLLKTIGYVAGPRVIERPDFQDEVEATSKIPVIDDKDKVLKSLNSTHLLNKLVEDGYLEKIHQGGNSPIVLDLNYDEDRETREVVPFGLSAQLQTMAHEVLDRNGRTDAALDGVDLNNFNAVIDAVNRTLGRTVLVIVSEPSQYRLTEEAVPVVAEKVE